MQHVNEVEDVQRFQIGKGPAEPHHNGTAGKNTIREALRPWLDDDGLYLSRFHVDDYNNIIPEPPVPQFRLELGSVKGVPKKGFPSLRPQLAVTNTSVPFLTFSLPTCLSPFRLVAFSTSPSLPLTRGSHFPFFPSLPCLSLILSPPTLSSPLSLSARIRPSFGLKIQNHLSQGKSAQLFLSEWQNVCGSQNRTPVAVFAVLLGRGDPPQLHLARAALYDINTKVFHGNVHAVLCSKTADKGATWTFSRAQQFICRSFVQSPGLHVYIEFNVSHELSPAGIGTLLSPAFPQISSSLSRPPSSPPIPSHSILTDLHIVWNRDNLWDRE